MEKLFIKILSAAVCFAIAGYGIANGNVSDTDDLWTGEYAYLTVLRNYLLNMTDSGVIELQFPYIFVDLTDYDGDGSEDAIVSTGASDCTLYYIVNNINDPKLVYDFSVSDPSGKADLLSGDNGQTVIKYKSFWGRFTYATEETNFIYLGENITETSYVHFSGTSGPEEFYITDGERKNVCSEKELEEAITETETELTSLTEIKSFRLTIDGKSADIESLDR